jgi:acetyl esterase/lipase
MKNIVTIFFLLFSCSLGAQGKKKYPVDTSFSVYGSWVKEKKKFPFITIAEPAITKNITVQQDIVYRTIGDRQLLLDIYRPAKTKKRAPVVLMIFGGGWRSGDKSHNRAMAVKLAEQGYVAVSAEYRLSLEASFPAAVQDLKAAVQWLKQHAGKYGIDTAKVATLGCSAGGQLAALMGNTNGNPFFEDSTTSKKYSSDVQAVVNIDGTLAFKHPESVEGTVAAQWLGGTWEQNPDAWTNAAPLTHIHAQSPPFLFVNSSIPRFHAGRDDMIKKMDEWGIYHETKTFPDTPHTFWFFNPWFNEMMDTIVSYLDKVFKLKK